MSPPPPGDHDFARKLKAVRRIQEYCTEADRYGQLGEVFAFILKTIHDALDFHHSMIYLLNPGGEELTFHASCGYVSAHVAPPIKVGQGLIGMAAKSGEILRAGNLGTFLRYTGAVRSKLLDAGEEARLDAPKPLTGLSNVQSQMAVPLKTSTQVIGIIAVESEQPAAFDEVDQELLLLVAGQTAQLIDRLRQAEQLRRAEPPRVENRFTLMNTLLQTVTSEPAASFLDHLTKREREVAVYVAQGLSNTEIAEALGLSVRTITTHLERIYDKLDVRSRSALTHYLYQQFL